MSTENNETNVGRRCRDWRGRTACRSMKHKPKFQGRGEESSANARAGHNVDPVRTLLVDAVVQVSIMHMWVSSFKYEMITMTNYRLLRLSYSILRITYLVYVNVVTSILI